MFLKNVPDRHKSQTITVNHGTLEQEAEIAATGMHDNRQNSFRFQFHHVLHNAGQDTIYDGLARDVVQGAVDGISGELEKSRTEPFCEPKVLVIEGLLLDKKG